MNWYKSDPPIILVQGSEEHEGHPHKNIYPMDTTNDFDRYFLISCFVWGGPTFAMPPQKRQTHKGKAKGKAASHTPLLDQENAEASAPNGH